jgi:type II secretory pathway pseudopilin PulG
VPEWMQAYMAQQHQQMQALQEQYQAQIQAFQAALAVTNSRLETPTETPRAPTPMPGPGIARPKAILPNPPKFDGTRSEYEGWRSLIRDKIDIDGEVIGSARN